MAGSEYLFDIPIDIVRWLIHTWLDSKAEQMISSWLDPSRNNLQSVGIKPDFYVALTIVYRGRIKASQLCMQIEQ